MRNKNNCKINGVLKILLVLWMLMIAGTISENIHKNYKMESKTLNSPLNQANYNPILNKINIIINFLSIRQISVVSAAEVCCEKVSGGGWCLDTEDGWCSPGSPKSRCEIYGPNGQLKGKWSENPGPECEPGCCGLYENTKYTTRKACEILSGDFKDSVSEENCKFLTTEFGACIIPGGCMWATNEKCYGVGDLGGIDFKKGVYCSNEGLETEYGYNYVPNSSKLCYDGDVYWQDNNANMEGIAEDCKEGEETCDINSVGEYYCKSTSCVYEGKKRVDKESWCVYDAYVGDSRDYPGSEHFKFYCDNGEVKVETNPGEHRNMICAENVDPVTGISTAQLRDNLWKECFLIDNAAECNNHPDCRLHSVYVDTYFKFDACVPKYPPGFDIYSEKPQENGEAICGLANIDCLQVWDDDSTSDNDLEANGRCDDPSYYLLQMHSFCASLGDCGSSFNYKGNYTYSNKEGSWSALYFAERVCNDIVREYEARSGNGITSDWSTTLPDLNIKIPGRNVIIPSSGLNTNIFDLDKRNYNACLGFLADFEKSKDKFSVTGGVYPEWIRNAQRRSDGDITSIELINSLIAGRGEAVGNKYWEDQGISDGAAGAPDIYYEPYSFTCAPSRPPVGGGECYKCNDNPLIKCTNYRCNSLGGACEILGETKDTDNPLCVDRFGYRTDLIPPQISFGTISPDYRVTPGADGVSISLADGTCSEKYSNVSFTLNTDENAKCYTSEDKSTLLENLEDGHDYNTTHFIEKNLGIDNKLRLFTICQDVNGNPNTKEYIVDICVSPQPDHKAPEIRRFIPESGSYLPFGETKRIVTLKINEPAVCRYAKTPYVPIESMSYLCETDDEGIGPYSCTAEIEDLTSPQNDIYIRCNDTLGNFHQSDILYTLFQTREALKIEIVSPLSGSIRETPISASNPLILEVKTSKGAYNGDSICSYKFLEQGWGAEFFETGLKKHRQEFSTGALVNGYYNIKVKCEDAAGNKAETIVSFSINIDKEPPVIINKSVSGTTMTLATDEPAECVYNTTSCNYLFRDALKNDISYGRTTTHKIYDFSKRIDYYVRCMDEFGNEDCTAIWATEKNDGLPPEAVRVFYDSDETGDLKLITDEDAQCRYKTSTCSFNFEEGQEMSRGYSQNSEYSREHYAPWNLNTKYHIKCKDSWGNVNTGCLIIVEPIKIAEIEG
ncbi:hypothetical protein HYT23_00175 [Candidatus Pacearchaeota archaeon]|nr:hypothetical protein [Candidatus Pacearchaeota archaeon]